MFRAAIPMTPVRFGNTGMFLPRLSLRDLLVSANKKIGD